MEKLTELPKDLPVPVDDGACNHLLELLRTQVRFYSSSNPGRSPQTYANPGLGLAFQVDVETDIRTSPPTRQSTKLPKQWISGDGDFAVF